MLPSPSPLPRLCSVFCALLALTLAVPHEAAARQAGNPVVTSGGGTSTLTSLVENPDGTLTIEAYQEGFLRGLGRFDGFFSYVAHIDYDTGITQLIGSGMFVTPSGDELHLSVHLVQVGLDYPRPFTGMLTVQGGTGRFARASGLLTISGQDDESLTDRFELSGAISMRGQGPK